MAPGKNHEEPLIKRLARSRALNSRNVSRDASMSPTRYETSASNSDRINQLPPGQPGNNGQYVQYVPCAFILPNYGNVSVSLPSLNQPQPQYRSVTPVFPHRKLSKLSNLVWTSSVSQPDLTRPTTTPTMSPATSVPTSRASSPAPPSISARCSPHGVPSPYLSPMESRVDIDRSSSLGQFPPQMHLAPGSSTTPARPNMSVHDVYYLNSALNQLAVNQHDVNGNGPPQYNYLPPPPATNTGYYHHPGNQDPGNGWYYLQQASVTTNMENIDLKSGSCSPRQVTFGHQDGGVSNGAVSKKPCAVIAPIAPNNGQQNLNQLVSNKQQPQQPSSSSQSTVDPAPIIKNSSLVSSVKLDNEAAAGLSFYPASTTQNNSWTLSSSTETSETANFSSLKLRERSITNSDTNLSDQLTPSKRSIGTSCSDLESNLPFVVETCQICKLFHPKVEGDPTKMSNTNATQCFVYSPCLHGNQVILKSTGNKNSNNQLNPNRNTQSENKSPVKYNKNFGMEQIKRWDLELSCLPSSPIPIQFFDMLIIVGNVNSESLRKWNTST